MLMETVGLARKHGVQAIGHVCDVSDPAANDGAVDDLLERWQTLNVFVINAGVCYYGPTLKMTRGQMNKLLAINLNAPIQFTTRLLPTLLRRPEAHVLNAASMYGLVVTALCPGFVATDLFTSMVDPESNDAVRKPPKWVCTTTKHVSRKAIYRDQRLVLVTSLACFVYYACRLAPGLKDWFHRFGRSKKSVKRN